MQIKTDLNNLSNHKIYLKVEQATHEFMQERGYLKVDVPVLSPALIPESYLEVFETDFSFFKRKEKLYLTPSPELFLKRLLVSGIGNCYYLGKAFRNSELSSDLHAAEFTMLEFYNINVTYLDVSDRLLELMRHIAQRIYKKDSLIYQGNAISFKKWEKLTVAQAFEQYSGIKEQELFNQRLFMKKAAKKGYNVKGFMYADVFSQIVSQEIEPKLGKKGYPSLLYDYPYELSALSKKSKDRMIAERVEFYINGIEIGGCCTELNDWKEQDNRFHSETKLRRKKGMIDHMIDKGFIEALQYGLPNCTGAGVGFDRLAMVFVDAKSIDKIKIINIIP